MSRSKDVTIDFEYMAELFRVDPEQFERERRRIIEREIEARPPEQRHRLRQFQWVLDMKRKRCKSPLEACFMYHEMLMNQVYGPGGLLESLEGLKSLLMEHAQTLREAEGFKAQAPCSEDLCGHGQDCRVGQGGDAAGAVMAKVIELDKVRGSMERSRKGGVARRR